MKKILTTALMIFIFAMLLPKSASAAAVSWDGGASTANWSDATNWSNNVVPTADDDVTVSTPSGTLTVNLAAATTVNSLTVGNVGGTGTTNLNFSYNAIANGALTIDSGNLLIYTGGNITHSAATSVIIGTINIDVQAGNATISGSINVVDKGYSQGNGLSPAPSTAGGSHGGIGGNMASAVTGTTYGDVKNPVTLGSGAGVSTRSALGGGGAIKLVVSGILTINGTVNSNGGNQTGCYPSSGAAGGSVNLTAGTINGAGAISAVGGNGCTSTSPGWAGGGGGGGRISIRSTTNNFAGAINAYGGDGTKIGGAGTIYTSLTSQTNGDLRIDNSNKFCFADYGCGDTPISGTYTFDTITIQNYGRLDTVSSTNITYTTLNWSTKGIVADNGGTFELLSGGGNLVVPATSYLYANTARTLSSISVSGTLTHSQNFSNETYKIDLTTTGDFTVNSGATINVNAFGYSPMNGPGAGGYAAGGGYGGTGGSATTGVAGPSYGSMVAPVNIGSGGSWGASDHNGGPGSGGGAIKITVGGTLNNLASITANAGPVGGCWNSGGGAGGSIYITTGNISGSTGGITANGSNACNNNSSTGGGAGGRIAIYYSGTNTYTGSITVTAGTGGLAAAQTGTKLIKSTGGELISTPFNTGDPATLIYNLTWTESLPSGTDVRIQLRTAPDNGDAPGTWTAWMGPDGGDTYFTDPTGLTEGIYSTQSDVTNDQWFQYKVILSSGSTDQNIPTFSDITVTYVVNSPPTVSITNTPTESSTGVVDVNYTISDAEESTLTTYLASDIGITLTADYAAGVTTALPVSSAANFPSSGTITIDNEMITYTGKSGSTLTGISRGANSTANVSHASSASVWFVSSFGSLSGDYGSVSTTGAKSLTWRPSTDLIGLETTTAKIKVVANDGNLANQVGSDTVNSVTLDTKAPVNGDIFINNRTNKLTLSATDGNTVYYQASNNNDLSPDGVNPHSGEWLPFETSIDWTLPIDPATVYAAYKDAYGNITSTYTTTGPDKLTSFLIQDASIPLMDQWRLFVSWPVIGNPSGGFGYYQIYRSNDNVTYTPYMQISNQALNYFVDTNLVNSSTYYYKTTVVDGHGNESDYNNPGTSGTTSKSGVGLTPDGSGGGDFTAPVISASSVSNITTSSALISWTTDEPANTTVGYSVGTSYANEIGSITMTTDHSITIKNLLPNITYHYRLISFDGVSNKAVQEDSSTQYFTTSADTTGPVISNIKSVAGQENAGITWSTSEESDSLVEYSVDTSYSLSSSSATPVLGHAVALSGLSNDTTYNYKVASKDVNGNTSYSPSYTFKTSSVTALDTIAPTISNISVSDVTAASSNVSWNTDEDADGKVEYGESTSYERGIAEGNHNFAKSKSVTLIGLSPETTYHYRVTVVDLSGNINVSGDANFVTPAQSVLSALSDSGTRSGDNSPEITSSGPSTSEITSTGATITWTTSKKSTSQIYYKIKDSEDPLLSGGDVNLTSSHEVTLGGLIPSSTYEYQVKSVDVNGNYATSKKYEFTTSLATASQIKVTRKSPNEVVLSWITVSPTTTIVDYTNTNTNETKHFVSASLTNSHSAGLTGLIASTVYSFQIVTTDENNNTGRSETQTFVTDKDFNGPAISAVNSKSTTISGKNKIQTIITWSTDEPATSQVVYSQGSGNSQYDQQTKENSDYVINHIVVLSDLKPGSVYRFKIVSKDRSSNPSESEPYVLLTPQKEVSALDLIIQNLQSSFGWVRGFGI